LPPYDYAILDEAHQCESWASAALTATLSASGINRLMRRVHRTYQLPASYDAEIDESMRGLVQTLARVPGERYPLSANENALEALAAVQRSFYRLENWVYANWQAALKRPSENVAEAERRRDLVMRGVLAHIATVDRTALPDDEAISWVERTDGDGRYAVNSAPFDVADYLRTALFNRTQSVVLTSATIATGSSFAFLRRTLGVDDAQEYVAPSPFDYATQARLFVAIAIRKTRASRAASLRCSRRSSTSRAAARSCSSRRTRGYTKSTRSCARRSSFRRNCKARCRARICSTGSAARTTRCSSRRRRFGKASTSSAISSLA